jgi:FixJ family two-component response regulator
MSASPPTRSEVVLVEDDEDLGRSLLQMLELAGLHGRRYTSSEAFLAAHDPAEPGCAILDLRLPGMSGLELQRRMRERGDRRPIVFLTGHGDVSTSVAAMKAGAVDFLEKPVRPLDLLDAVRRALALDGSERAKRTEILELQRRYETLTPRERQLADALVVWQHNKRVSSELGIAERTVKFHRANVLAKMGAETLADLVRSMDSLRAGAES